jgi:hypothetical protein
MRQHLHTGEMKHPNEPVTPLNNLHLDTPHSTALPTSAILELPRYGAAEIHKSCFLAIRLALVGIRTIPVK